MVESSGSSQLLFYRLSLGKYNCRREVGGTEEPGVGAGKARRHSPWRFCRPDIQTMWASGLLGKGPEAGPLGKSTGWLDPAWLVSRVSRARPEIFMLSSSVQLLLVNTRAYN